MNFMRITTPKDIRSTLPAEKQAKLQVASRAYWQKNIKAGKLKDFYYLTDGRVVTTWSFSSIEEMVSTFGENPMGQYLNSETVPFLDLATLVKMADERIAAKKTPSKK